jgi:hypothetical protein
MMTLTEARTLLFITEALNDLQASLRVDQIAALTSALDMTQKILLMEVMFTILPSPSEDEVVWNDRRRAWAQLVQAAKDRVAVFEDPLRPKEISR